MFLVPVILLTLLAGAQSCTFQPEAEGQMELDFRKKAGSILRLTDLEVRLPTSLVPPGCEGQLVLRVGTGANESAWNIVQSEPRLKNKRKPDRHLSWSITEGAVPCRTHHAKICFNPNDCIQAKLAPASEDLMAEKQYSPGRVKVKTVKLRQTTEETLLVWEGRECATKFSVTVKNTRTQKVVKEAERLVAGLGPHKLALTDLAPCSEYDIELVPWVGTYEVEDDAETVEELSTGPSKNSLDNLKFLDNTDTTVKIAMPHTTDTSCVDHYKLSVCPEGSSVDCREEGLELVDGEEASMIVTGLDPDTLYGVQVDAVEPDGKNWKLGDKLTFRTKKTAKVVPHIDTQETVEPPLVQESRPSTAKPTSAKPSSGAVLQPDLHSGSGTADLALGLLALGALVLNRVR